MTAIPASIELTGRTFGSWIVLGPADDKRRLMCVCKCGTRKSVLRGNLTRGLSKSCGCGQNRTARRGGVSIETKYEYIAWGSMIRRCEKPQEKCYPQYGGRGISVCDRWKKFQNFLEDMGPRPSADHSLDRIDNDGDYGPDNCRWATRSEQQNNRRCNHRLTFKGRTLTIAEWARELGCPRHHIANRIKSGWSVEAALTTPFRRNQSHIDVAPRRVRGVSFRPGRNRPWIVRVAARGTMHRVGAFPSFDEAVAARNAFAQQAGA